MFGYEIVKLSPEEVATRRVLLDQAGYNAYITPIILLISFYATRKIMDLLPIGNGKDASAGKKPSQPQLISRRASWILNNTYIAEFGPLYVQVIGLFYLAWLLYLIFANTGNDYMHVTKAFGHVAVSQLPLHYLLAIKSPNSPITLATGLTHERLNAFHRLFGRIVHALLATHAILYLSFFQKAGLLSKRIMDWDVRLGLMAFWSVNILGFLAIAPIRKKAYHALFYRSHILLSILVVFIVWMHVPYTRLYVAQAGIFWFANGMVRQKSTEKVQPVCENIGSGLISVKVQGESARFAGFEPGMHMYLRHGLTGPRTPFTVLQIQKSEESDKSQVELLVKDSGGPMTGYLGEIAKTHKEIDMYLEGPYGEAKEYMPELLDGGKEAGKVLLVAGGVGATYILPIFKALVEARGGSSGLKLILVVKSSDEAAWAANFVGRFAKSNDVTIHLTAQKSAASSDAVAAVIVQGRPNLNGLVGNFFAPRSEIGVAPGKQDPRKPRRSYEPVTVMSCGPPGLTQDLRKAVSRHVMGYGRDVRWYEEQFGFGGS